MNTDKVNNYFLITVVSDSDAPRYIVKASNEEEARSNLVAL